MRQTLAQPNRMRQRRRASTDNRLTFGRFAGGLAVVSVLILLGVTFLGDYLRVPNLSVSASPQVISPNGDQTQDRVSLNYNLSDEGAVTVEVLTANGANIRTLSQIPNLAAGQYVAVWDGRNADNAVVADGRYILQVTAAGASRTSVQAAEVTVDTEPPILRLTNLDTLTRVADPNLVIEGITEPGATVYQAGDAVAIPVDGRGAFEIERQLTEGVNILEIIASDQAGNTARTSHEVALITQPPELTLTKPANDTWFNEPVVEVAGTALGASAVTVNQQPVLLDENGVFDHELILQEGENQIRVEVTDDVGNVTVRERLVQLKTTPPQVTLNIDDGAMFQQSSIQLTGRTDPGATVLVNNQLVPVSTLGEFQTTLNLLNGVNNVRIEARDIAGNTATLNRIVRFESPAAQSEMTRLLRQLPTLTSLATPLAILLPTLLLLGYLFTRPVTLQLSADRENFTPGAPDEERVMTFVLDLSRDARTSVEVLNAAKRPVATLMPRRQRSSGEHVFAWDGYDDYGNILPGGEYTVQATASTPGASVISAVPITLFDDPLTQSQYLRQTPPQTYEPESLRTYRRVQR